MSSTCCASGSKNNSAKRAGARRRGGAAKVVEPQTVPLVVVGSVGLDTVCTPCARRQDLLGGSASYACAAASFFSTVGMVGVVGTDFPLRHRRLYKRLGIDLAGLQVQSGKTFRWSGEYAVDMNQRRTLCTELNVFASFAPALPPGYSASPYLFLANISPDLQLHVLDRMQKPRFVAADTMDLWIRTCPRALRRVIRRVDLLLINESEARLLTGQTSLLTAARRLLRLGPRFLIIKKGEHGSMLFTPNSIFLMPAYPLEHVRDPTGAGDAFAGGLMGALAGRGRVSERALKNAMARGSILASFAVESFGLDGLSALSQDTIRERIQLMQRMMRMD